MLRRFTASPSVAPRFAGARLCSTAAPTVMTACTMLTEEERAIQESVRQFAKSKIEPLSRKMDEEEHMPQEIITEGFKAGLMGIETPAELGGAGMNFMSSAMHSDRAMERHPECSGRKQW